MRLNFYRIISVVDGSQQELTEVEELVLVNYIKYMASISQPLTIPAVKLFAWEIVKQSERSTRFNESSGLGHTWW